tara:strand:+ start:488 stop:1066 length:579 start_codon:yes stop_codon:yes gene_type:complete
MKKIIQLILFSFVIIISVIFYKVYFGKNTATKDLVEAPQEDLNETSKNNLIKNLKYEVKLDQENQYTITSEQSEITYENDIEKVKMQKVIAIFTDKNKIPLIITSDKAIYNNTNYNTNFINNVQIEYLDNFILSDKMDLNFKKNTITISKNVRYQGLQGTIMADNVKIDLITKKIKIYMDENNKKVEVATNK